MMEKSGKLVANFPEVEQKRYILTVGRDQQLEYIQNLNFLNKLRNTNQGVGAGEKKQDKSYYDDVSQQTLVVLRNSKVKLVLEYLGLSENYMSSHSSCRSH